MPNLIDIPTRGISTVRSVSLLLFPHGGQATARANAFGAIIVDRHRAKDREEAFRAMPASRQPVSPARAG